METPELTLKEALKNVKELGYNYIRFNYNGSGDSGDVDAPDFYETLDEATNERVANVDWTKNQEFLKLRRIRCQNNIKPIEIVVDKVLNGIEDWWNNDGGSGYIIINTETGTYEIENNIYYTESNTYNHEGTLE